MVMEGWMDKYTVIIHMMEYYSVWKQKEILTHTTT